MDEPTITGIDTDMGNLGTPVHEEKDIPSPRRRGIHGDPRRELIPRCPGKIESVQMIDGPRRPYSVIFAGHFHQSVQKKQALSPGSA